MSRCQTGFMDGDRCHGWQFVANGFRSQVLSVIEICKGSIPLGGLSGANDISLLTDSSLVGFEFVYPASCWADSRESHGELTDYTRAGSLTTPGIKSNASRRLQPF